MFRWVSIGSLEGGKMDTKVLGDPEKVIKAEQRAIVIEQIAFDVHHFVAGLIKAGMSENDALNMGSFIASEGYRQFYAHWAMAGFEEE